MAYRQCGARSKRYNRPCRQPAMANGRCRMHGGKSTGPKDKSKHYGNKNALKTGARERIWFDTLEPEELALVDQISTDVHENIDEEIILYTIRIRRMLRRINELKQANQGLVLTEIELEQGEDGESMIDKTKEKYQNNIELIQRCEEALTRVQEKKTRLLDLKAKLETGDGEGKVDVSSFMKIMGVSAREVWDNGPKD